MKIFKLFALPMPHVRKLEAHTNRILYAGKSFGGVSDFNVLSNNLR